MFVNVPNKNWLWQKQSGFVIGGKDIKIYLLLEYLGCRALKMSFTPVAKKHTILKSSVMSSFQDVSLLGLWLQ